MMVALRTTRSYISLRALPPSFRSGQLLDGEDVAVLVERLVAAQALGLVDRPVLLVEREDGVVPVAVLQHLRHLAAPAGAGRHRGEEQLLLGHVEAVRPGHGIAV